MARHGLDLLKANGFRPVGPWVVEVGRWSEVTYLFRFDSLAERERLIAKFSPTAEAKASTRGLVNSPKRSRPASWSRAVRPSASAQTPREAQAIVGTLPHRDQLVRGFTWPASPTAIRSANCGWVALARGDAAHRPAPRNARAGVPGHGRRDHRQARPDTGADPCPGW